MFFFIGGISPRIKRLDHLSLTCPRCGLNTLHRVRVDHYLNLFFIPVFPVKKGRPVFLCENCGLELLEEASGPAWSRSPGPQAEGTCPGCGRMTQADFKFCPYCGRSLN